MATNEEVNVKSERLEVSNTDSRDSTDVKDSVKEVTTVTVQLNEVGDTVRISTVTERDRMRSITDVKRRSEEMMIVRDTVYIERKDSVRVQDSGFKVQGTGTKSNFVLALKWIFWILVCVIVLVIIIKVTRLTSGRFF